MCITKMAIRLCLGIFVFIGFSSCSDDLETVNKIPTLELNLVPDGLKVALKGSATDSDGSVANVMVNWGDNTSEYLMYMNFDSIYATHEYYDPANYTIRIVVFDNAGDSSVYLYPVNLVYKETSLAGIKPSLFKTSQNEYLVLTINLHTYQESQQNEKLQLITDVIGKMNIDFIAFQECAQNKSTPIKTGIIREDNMALIISDRLKQKYNADYNFVWNWAHYGWNEWEEGMSILSRHPLFNDEDRYISTSTNKYDIASRKVIYGAYQTVHCVFNIFSAHTHWRTSITDEEQNMQIRKIKWMAEEKWAGAADSITFICGDFNGNPTSDYPWSEGYHTMMNNNEYSDTFLSIYPDANNRPAQNIYNTIGGDFPGRIDYVFMKNNPHLIVKDSQIIFTTNIIGMVSDHFGVLTKVAYIE